MPDNDHGWKFPCHFQLHWYLMTTVSSNLGLRFSSTHFLTLFSPARRFSSLSLSVCFSVSIVLYSSIYIAPLNSQGSTEALLVLLAPRKETSFKKRYGRRKIG